MTSLNILNDVKLDQYTSWKIGGYAQYYFAPQNFSELREACQWARQEGHDITVLSGGTNVLVSDLGVRGLVIHLRKFNKVSLSEDAQKVFVSAEAGVAKSEILKIFLKYQLQPALFLAGLPGDVGSGVVMNAGVRESFIPREFEEITESIEVYDYEKDVEKTFKSSELQWSYRKCVGWQPGIVTKVLISWPKSERDESVLKRVKEANTARLAKQPLEWPSCGSVFKNPEGDSAGRLIEQAGLKGFRIGDAQISEKHANFIVNLGSARAAEVLELIEKAQSEVKLKFGIDLHTEVVRLGEF